MARRRQSGMTLVETLVALAILTSVVISAYAMLVQSARFAVAEQDRLIAAIVADNEAAKLMIRQAPLDQGEEEVEIEAAGRLWRAHRNVEEFGDGLLKVTITVSRPDDAQPLSRIETVRAKS